MLEHHAHLLPVTGQIDLFAGDLHAIHLDRAGGWSLQQVETAQEGAFAAAGGTNNRNDIAPADIHRDAIHGVNGAAIIVLFQIRYFDDLLRHLRHRSFPL